MLVTVTGPCVCMIKSRSASPADALSQQNPCAMLVSCFSLGVRALFQGRVRLICCMVRDSWLVLASARAPSCVACQLPSHRLCCLCCSRKRLVPEQLPMAAWDHHAVVRL